MKRQEAGFTLIELVVVIIILGILAAVALPKFMGLSTDARVSVVNGMSGSVNEAADMVHALAEVQGTVSGGTVTLPGGTTVTIDNGYPDSSATGILLALQGGSTTVSAAFPFTFVAGTGKPATSVATFEYTATSTTDGTTTTGTPNTTCTVTYTPPASSGDEPTIGEDLAGC